MLKRTFLLAVLAAASARVSAGDIRITTFRHVGPLPLSLPLQIDTTDVNGKPFDVASLLQTPLNMDAVRHTASTSDTILAADALGRPALHLSAFAITNTSFAKATVAINGIEHKQLYIDGAPIAAGTATDLIPGTHEVIIKALTTATPDTMSVTVGSTTGGSLSTGTSFDGKLYTMDHVLHARRYGGVQLSPDGRWLIAATTQTQPGGQSLRTTELRHLATGRTVRLDVEPQWMPRTASYLFDRMRGKRRELVATDPATGGERVLCSDLPEGSYTMLPTEDRLILTIYDKAPAERDDVYEVVHPDDRQPGWRTRPRLALYDLHTGLAQPLTFGHASTYLADVSRDGTHALVIVATSHMGPRPTDRMSLLRINLATLAADTLVSADGFVAQARFSPDGRRVLISGSPEALGGIGRKVRPDQTPSMVDGQLFIMDIATRRVEAITRDFNPSVVSTEWSSADGMIYFRAEDRDSINLFRYDPAKRLFLQLAMPEEVVSRFSLAAEARKMAVVAQSACNSDRLYLLDLATAKGGGSAADTDNNCASGKVACQCIEDLSATTLRGVELGACMPYTYTNAHGDHISCRYYLPPGFDASRSYPLIVNYYGGCSPTSRNFETRYPHHAYAALGYVVLVVNPRGATGFGQEWSAAHVNTAGEGVAQDIIGAVEAFARDHSWVNSKKIGCIGASYGGFMTQYLQTKTDIFAAAVSHAGISDHTSYWGEGYWGYTYSQVSMANSYPWTRRDLYVEQSPLYNADKIHTPLLFVHGDADHNVPVGESIQMYTALKLLGCPTAMVLVKDQDHHITDYDKRLRWQYTIWAWFARYLQDDPTWWQSMYPDKDL